MIDLDEYLNYKELTNLYIRYDKDSMIDYLYYRDETDDVSIKCHIKQLDEIATKKDITCAWDIEYSKEDKDAKPISIISSYITKEHIEKLLTVSKNSFLPYHFNCDSSGVQNNHNGTYSFVLSNDTDKEFELIFENKYSLGLFDSGFSKTLKIMNNDNNKFEAMHYLDSTLYYTANYIENTETIYLSDQNIKYEFKHPKLSISNYLQFHHPFRVTNYTQNKQYLIEYDKVGIMKSMIDISNPDKNLCIYDKSDLFEQGGYQVTSIHPNIYDAFDKHKIDYYTKSNKKVIEIYSNMFPIDYSSYTRKIIEL